MKRVKEWAGDAGTGGFTNVVKDRRYVYDGWNMIAELDHTTATGTGLAGATVVRTKVWGQDLSGTMQGAGGVGGLLAVRHGGQTYVPLMDGNGNVMGLQGLGGAKDGQTVARYDYDAFGNRITNTAPELGEEVNPFGFSTKFTDEETGLVYYGYRYYSPEVGRWVSRDPIGEQGGINLYGMVGNDGVGRVDVLGLTDVDLEVLAHSHKWAAFVMVAMFPLKGLFEAPALTIESSRWKVGKSAGSASAHTLLSKVAAQLCSCPSSVDVDETITIDTVHVWSIGQTNIKVKGDLDIVSKKGDLLSWRFVGEVEPLGDRFDFLPIPNGRPLDAEVVTFGGLLVTFAGALVPFDILATGPVDHVDSGTILCKRVN
jgi:RHS repeat-associated protein